jgi:hypothetical protein
LKTSLGSPRFLSLKILSGFLTPPAMLLVCGVDRVEMDWTDVGTMGGGSDRVQLAARAPIDHIRGNTNGIRLALNSKHPPSRAPLLLRST